MQEDAIKPGQNVVVVDDLIATGTQSSSVLLEDNAEDAIRWLCESSGTIGGQAWGQGP